MVVGIICVVLVALLLFAVVKYGSLWLQSYFSSANMGIVPLVRMSLRAVKPSTIVTAKVMGQQAGLGIDREGSISTSLLNRALAEIATGKLAQGFDDLTAVLEMDGAPAKVKKMARQKLAKRNSLTRS